MADLKLPPVLDIPSLVKPTVEETIKAWNVYIEEGAKGVAISFALKTALKVYQGVPLGALTSGYNLEKPNHRLAVNILSTLWHYVKDANIKIDLHEYDHVVLPVREHQLKFPVIGVYNDNGRNVLLCVQARKKSPFKVFGYPFFGAMLKAAVPHTQYPDADVEIYDISAPDGKIREPFKFRLSAMPTVSEAEMDEGLGRLLAAYDILKTMPLPSKPKLPKKPTGQGKLF